MARRHYQDEETRPVIDARAPYADPSQNVGASTAPPRPGSGGPTDGLTWANQFRRRDSQLAALPGTEAGARSGEQAVVPTASALPSGPTAVDHILGAINEAIPKYLNRTAASQPAPFSFASALGQAVANGYNNVSLSDLASGGQNHAQRWQVGDNGTITQNANGSRTLTSPYGGGTTTFTGGPRAPFIAGADGKNVAADYVAGGRYSSYKAGSDPTLGRYSWASAFR